MRLIDADKLKDIISDTWVLDRINEQPTVEPKHGNLVEVVSCKDCKWGKEACGNIECFVDLNAPTEYHGYNWFCPNGEGKDEVEE